MRATANPVEIQLADETGYHWHGRMEFVDNAIDPQSGTIRAHARGAQPQRFPDARHVRPRAPARLGHLSALLVPDEAILTDQTRKLVYVARQDGKVAPRAVETGPQVEGLRVIKQRLAPTERW